MSTQNGHGGSRAGSGRPRNARTRARSSEKVSDLLLKSFEDVMGTMSASMPEIMERLLDSAFGEADKDVHCPACRHAFSIVMPMPDKDIMKMLFSKFLAVTAEVEASDSELPIHKLARELKEATKVAKAANQ